MLMEKIADYAIRERSSKLPKEVIHHAKRAVIDWYASLLPGSRVAPAVQGTGSALVSTQAPPMTLLMPWKFVRLKRLKPSTVTSR